MSGGFEPLCRRMEWLDPFYKAVWEEAFAKAIPISGTFELTPRCNFDCKMCYVHLKEDKISMYGRELSAKEWIRIAEQAKKAGTTWLCVTGGEPLMHPEFPEIWKVLSKMGFFVTLQTNASMVGDGMLEFFDEYPPHAVKLTLYGSNDETYEKVCGIKQGFTRVDRAIQELKKRKIPIELVSTIIKQNEDDILRMAYYAARNGLPWINTVGVKPSVRGADSRAREVAVSNKYTEEAFRRSLKRRVQEHPMSLERKPCTMCKDYRLGYWITWNGDMRFCGFMNEPNIPVRSMAFLEAWKSLMEYEEQLEWPQECKTCKAQEGCLRCAGILSAECGGPQQVREEFCNRVKQYYDKKEERWRIE